MVRTMLLLFKREGTWAKIASEERSLGSIVAFFIIPLVALSLLPEFLINRCLTPSVPVWETIQRDAFGAVGNVIAVFIASCLIQLAGQGLLCRFSYRKVVSVVAYSLGPLILTSACNGLPDLVSWIVFGVGLLFSLMVLHGGIRLLEPHPTQAFGLFMTAAFVIIILTATTHLFNMRENPYDLLLNLRLNGPQLFKRR